MVKKTIVDKKRGNPNWIKNHFTKRADESIQKQRDSIKRNIELRRKRQ